MVHSHSCNGVEVHSLGASTPRGIFHYITIIYFVKKQTDKQPQYIYLIQKNTESIYKIGISDNPLKRLKQLQTGNSARLHLIKVFAVKDARAIEKRLHRLLMFHRCSPRGEWFNLSEEYLKLVSAVCHH